LANKMLFDYFRGAGSHFSQTPGVAFEAGMSGFGHVLSDT
jgi:hypothetical protein